LLKKKKIPKSLGKKKREDSTGAKTQKRESGFFSGSSGLVGPRREMTLKRKFKREKLKSRKKGRGNGSPPGQAKPPGKRLWVWEEGASTSGIEKKSKARPWI